jgi:peroxiredoxin
MVFLLAGCNSSTSSPETSATNEAGKLPQFEAIDSEGNRLLSTQLNGRVVITAFFDPDSVLAWRTLSELSKKQQSQKGSSVFAVGFASSRIASDSPPDISALKREYQITFPIVPDPDKHFSEAFQSPNCCDYLTVYNGQGKLKTSMKLSESYSKLDSLTAESFNQNPANDHPFALTADDILTGIKIIKKGAAESLPTTSHGLTIVNFFDEFCTECPTGNRFQTLDYLNRLRSPLSRILIVFSKDHFSGADVENFKSMLSMSDSLIQGDMEVAKPYLIKGKFLIVLDENKKLIWQERPGMPEGKVLADVSRLLQASTKNNDGSNSSSAMSRR